MPIHLREFYPTIKKEYSTATYNKNASHLFKEDQGNRKSIVWFYLFKIWNKGKWIPGASGQRSGYFRGQSMARKEHGDFKATW